MSGRTARRLPLLALALLLTAAQPSPAAATDEGLVGHWGFDAGNNRLARDRAKGNDGEIQFGTVREEKACRSLEFDGIGTSVAIAPWRKMGLAQQITTAVWVSPRRLRDNTVLFGVPHVNPAWTTPIFGMYVRQGRVVYGMWLAGGRGKSLVESPAELPLNAWTHLAATSDGQTIRLFVNGKAVAEEAAQGQIVDSGQPLLIGRGAGANKSPFKGRIGELRIYSRALSADDVAELYRQTAASYDLRPDGAVAGVDGTVIVETHGNRPGDGPWRRQPTRLLELVAGYKPAADAAPVNAYGGWTERPREKATGFFYTKKIGDRHWLIDPEGFRFFHVAINTVREPKEVRRHFGSPEAWVDAVNKQLREIGFNGLGNGGSPRHRGVARPLIGVLRKNFMFEFAKLKKLTLPASGTVGFVNMCMPVFHPEFASFAEEFGKDLAETAGDPYLLGIMTDNELQCPTNLLDRYLELDAENPDLKPGRDTATAWLVERKGKADPAAITPYDRYQFIAYAFERYYQVVTPVIRRYDPNHLYLGSRINYRVGQFDNPWFWKAIAPYHDVVSVNYYGAWGPDPLELADWAAWAGRPILLTEWYAKAVDIKELANTHGAGWLVRTQEDRARYYQHFALAALEIPNIVGWHWFKYLDDPAESQALDSAGGANKGMFDIHGRPYEPLVRRATAVNREAYRLIEFLDARKR